jgi:hypothetical protein
MVIIISLDPGCGFDSPFSCLSGLYVEAEPPYRTMLYME